MSADWPTHSLSEFITIKHGFAFKGEYFQNEETDDYLVTPGNFSIGGGFKADKFKYYDGPVPDDYILSEGDLVVTMTDLSKEADTLGYSALIPAIEGKRLLHNQRIGLVEFKNDELDKTFLYFLLRSREYRHHVTSGATGSTVKHTSPTKIVSFEFKKPPYEVQVEIGKRLIAFENKILLNQKTNQTLEQIAQAIFKSWFVDFDPVRAKIAAREAFIQQHPELTLDAIRAAASTEGDTPAHAAAKACELAAIRAISGAVQGRTNVAGAGSAGATKTEEQLNELSADTLQQLKDTAALFPDALVDSELGEVPEGWVCGTLSDIGSFGDERIDVSELSSENYISTENMLEGKKGITAASSLPSVKTVPAFRKGQILVSNIRPYFKKIWLAQFEGGRSNDVLGFDADDPESIEYLYNLLFQDAFFTFMMTTSKGAKMPRGDKVAIMAWTIPIPDLFLRWAFSSAVRNYYEYSDSLTKENGFLESLRDSLLPKLLSGELTIESSTTNKEAVA